MTDIFSDKPDTKYQLTRTRKLIRTSVHRLRPRRIGLRNRILLIFVAGALLLSSVLAIVTYSFTRSNLVDQRVTTETNQAITNARRTQNDLLRSAHRDLLQTRRNVNPPQSGTQGRPGLHWLGLPSKMAMFSHAGEMFSRNRRG